MENPANEKAFVSTSESRILASGTVHGAALTVQFSEVRISTGTPMAERQIQS